MASQTLLAVACIAGGAAAGWLINDVTSQPPEATSPATAADADGSDANDLERLDGVTLGTETTLLANAEARADRLELANGSLKQELARLQTELATIRENAAREHAVADAADAGALRLKKYADVVEGIEWSAAGQAILNMQPHIAGLLEGMATGKMDTDLQMKVGRENLKLVNLAMSVKDKGLPGTDVNGSFTHPVVYVPLIAATLQEAGHPLSEDQRERLVTLGDAFIDADAAIRGRYDEQTLAFTKLADETRLKQRFFADVDALVTDVQRDALHPEEHRGRMGVDLFSAGLLWQASVAPLSAPTHEGRLFTGTTQAMAHLSIAAEHKDVVTQAVGDFLSRIPQELVNAPTSPLDRMGMVHMDRIVASLGPMEQLYAELLRVLPAQGPHVKAIQGSKHAFLPMTSTP